MSIDRSLKSGGGLSRHRNVLKRSERIERLKSEEKFGDDASPLGLVKVGNRNIKLGKKTKKKEGPAED